MTSHISHTTFDAIDAHAQSVFWAQVLGSPENPASQVADHRRASGRGWITMADPEGNEFCILPHNLPAFSPAE
jgi:hypothetical protein